MSDLIVDIVGQQAFDDIDRLKKELFELYGTFKKVSDDIKSIEISVSGGGDLKGLIANYNQLITKTKEYQGAIDGVDLKLERLKVLQAQQAVAASREQAIRSQTAIREGKELERLIELENRRNRARSGTSTTGGVNLNAASSRQFWDNYNKGIKEAEANGKAFSKQLQERIRLEQQAQKEAEKAARLNEKAAVAATPYEQLKRELQEVTTATRNYASSMELLRREGKLTEAQSKSMGATYDEMVKKQNELQASLNKIENDTGGSTRSRNALLVETNQLLREMPNFAISARTGILSLSNNLPMFFEAFSRVSKEIDNTTNKAKGFGGALKSLLGTLVSWQTILIVAVTVLTTYADEIGDLVSFTSDAEKTQRSLNKAIEEANKTYSSKIGVLRQLQSALGNTNVSLVAQAEALRLAQNEFPGYFDGLQAGASLTKQQNELILQQIALLKEKARQEAIGKVIQEQAEKVLNAENKALDTNVGFWERQWAAISSSTDSKIKDGKVVDDLSNSLKGLSEENIKIIRDYEKLKESGEISRKQFLALIERVRDAQKQGDSFNGTLERMNQLLGQQSGAIAKTYRTMTDFEVSLLNAQTEQKKFISGSKEWEEAGKNVEKYRKQVELAALDREFGGFPFERELNPEYIARRNAILADEVKQYKATTNRKEKILWDWRKAVLEVNEQLKEIEFQINRAQAQMLADSFKAIADDEKKTLDERLNASRSFFAQKEKIAKDDAQKELDILIEQEKRKKELEGKLGFSVEKTDDLKRLEKNEKITNEQKKFLADTLLINKQREKIENDLNESLNKIDKERDSLNLNIYDSEVQEMLRSVSDGLNAENDRIRRATNERLLALQEQQKKGTISYSRYVAEFKRITQNEGRDVFNAQLNFVRENIQKLTALIDTDKFKNAPKEIQDLIRATLNAYKEAEGTIARGRTPISSRYGGLGDGLARLIGLDEESLNQIDEVVDEAINTVKSLISTIDTLWDNYYKRQKMRIDENARQIEEGYKTEEYQIKSALLTSEERERQLEDLDAKRIASEKLLDRERRKIEVQQARRERDMAIFSIGISTAEAIAKVWAKSGIAVPVAIALSALIAAQGAMQIAAVMSKPLPAYEHGTPVGGHKGGLALVGEKRRELVVTPQGQMFYTPNKPTIMDLPAGAHVLPNPDAMTAMAKQDAINGMLGVNAKGQLVDITPLREDISKLASAVINKPETQFILSNGEWKKFQKVGNLRVNYIKSL